MLWFRALVLINILIEDTLEGDDELRGQQRNYLRQTYFCTSFS